VACLLLCCRRVHCTLHKEHLCICSGINLLQQAAVAAAVVPAHTSNSHGGALLGTAFAP
jgi:hypothetical protein